MFSSPLNSAGLLSPFSDVSFLSTRPTPALHSSHWCCSYAVAISYVLFDTYDKWQKTLADARGKLSVRPGIPPSVDLER